MNKFAISINLESVNKNECLNNLTDKNVIIFQCILDLISCIDTDYLF